MIRKSLIAAAVMLCGTVAFTSAAKADSVDILFNGTVESFCSFDDYTDGALETYAPNGMYSSTLGQASVTCTGGGMLTVQAPVNTIAPAGYDDSSVSKYVYLDGSGASGFTIGSNNTDSVPLNPGTTDISVYMEVGSGSPFPSGAYQYSVTLTATGQ